MIQGVVFVHFQVDENVHSPFQNGTWRPDFRRDQQFYTRNQTVIQMGTGVSKKQNSWVVKQTTLCFSVFTYVSVKHVFDMQKDYKSFYVM